MKFLSAVLLAALIASTIHARTFTDTTGRTLEAEIISFDGERVTVRRLNDSQTFTIPITRLSEDDQEFIRSWSPDAEPEPETVSEEELKRLNEIVGAPLFADGNLWDDSAADVAQRLGWPQESSTATQSSYRKYNGEKERLFGARPYSSVLYGKDGKVETVSIVFANKGDSAGNAFAMSKKQIECAVTEAVEKDGQLVSETLVALGEPEQQTTATGRSMKERLQRWDWQNHAILLAIQDEEYVSVRILPKKIADNRGRPERVSASELKAAAEANVTERPNGDVIITNIPMVDQGPKGYCVPATLERTLRYMGVPADMYLLAMAGQTSIGGGTYVDDLVEGAEKYVKSAGRDLKSVNVRMKASGVAKYIDDGQPIMWSMYSTPQFNTLANLVTKQRAQAPNIKDWEDQLDDLKKNTDNLEPDREMGHVCLIIGYNEETNEIAVSDSWGPEYEERWIPAEQAQNISQGGFWIVDF